MRTFSATWKHMRRSPYQSMAAILTMFLTFLFSGIFLLTTVASGFVLRFFESKPQITVFFTDKATVEDAQTLQKTLEATGKAASMKYVSKDDALKIYREQNKNDPLLLEMVTADILPASLEVSAVDPAYLANLEEEIKKADGVEEVVYQRDVVESLLAWTNAIRLVGGSLGILLAVNSVLIIMTIISMKVALKKEEVDILKLVGATSWYIRSPFVLEGGLYGVIGASVAWIVITGLVIWLRPVFFTFLGMVPIIHTILASATSLAFWGASAGFLGLLVASGFLLGSIGSLVALGRYLKF